MSKEYEMSKDLARTLLTIMSEQVVAELSVTKDEDENKKSLLQMNHRALEIGIECISNEIKRGEQNGLL